MAKEKILVTGTSVRAELLQPLIDAGFEVENPHHLLTSSELKEYLKSSSGYLLGGDEIATKDAISTAANLRVIAFLGMGYQSFIDVEAATAKEIPITNTPGTLSNSVAEFTVGLTLNSTRKLFKYGNNYSAGKTGEEQKQHDLANLHVGIIGLGGIGTRIAEILRNGFNAKVSYYSRTRKEAEEKRLNISYLSFADLLHNIDVLIVMVPKTAETMGMIGSDQVQLMKKNSIIINTARAEIVSDEALLAGLESGQIDYAAFDGFYDPSSTNYEKLKSFIPDKLMITGHIASLTHEARDGMAKLATQSIINIIKTGADAYIVNKINIEASTI